jgi:DNA-binding XRE family transcriptional regulator
MPLLTTEMKKALRRLQADELMTKKDLAKYLGVSESTAKTLTKDKEPLNVKTKVFNAVISAISESY